MKEGHKDITKQLTANRLVNSIDAALDIGNYNLFVLLENTTSQAATDETTEPTITFTDKPPTSSLKKDNLASSKNWYACVKLLGTVKQI